MGTEVKKQEKNLPATYEYEGYENAGFDNQGKDDYSIPFIDLLQGLSPELETLDKAKPGHIVNKVTQDLFDRDKGIAFVPCYTQHVFVEWVPRDNGGGLVQVHELNSEVVAKAKASGHRTGAIVLENGNELIETFYVFGVQVFEDETTAQAVVAFTSTKIKKYKAWMTKARTIQIKLEDGRKINPPLFAHRYRMKSVKEKNKHGEFYNWDITFDGEDAIQARLAPSSEVFQEAAQVMELVKSGQAKANTDSMSNEASGAGGTEDVPKDENGKPAF